MEDSAALLRLVHGEVPKAGPRQNTPHRIQLWSAAALVPQ